ncbi:hypothetical protein An12g08870 [Aspergillus niger]|uniref:Uncharacterized protein n=2 Tax=Aspergillus niger TaxID=5061 RepID=A2R0J9_ASPNC|nr:hypothetical protein An12g08870 [Aspergillus niger]CAK41337.1 hypothetical protein An12g08870 [Aspergillus niger]
MPGISPLKIQMKVMNGNHQNQTNIGYNISLVRALERIKGAVSYKKGPTSDQYTMIEQFQHYETGTRITGTNSTHAPGL